MESMKQPLSVHPLTPEEQETLEAGLRARDAFTVRRCQILLASNRGQRPSQIAQALQGCVQTVRNGIHAFERQGLACLEEPSHRAKSLHPVLDAPRREQLRDLLHHSPRQYGQTRSTWTLDMAAQVCFAQGITPQRLSRETIRLALKRMATSWKRAKHWISSPDPQYTLKKSGEIG